MRHKPKEDRWAPPFDAASPVPPGTGRSVVSLWNRCAPLVIAAILAALIALVFGQTLQFDFVNFDDDLLVYDNPIVKQGLTLAGIRWALTANVSAMWYPLTLVSYMADVQFYRLEPWGFHLTNVLLHAAASVVLFHALWRMTGRLWPSALVAALFAIHPLQVETVAWIGERKGPLSGLFFALALAAYARYARRPFSLWRYLPVALWMTLGLLAKPVLVTLPCVLLLLDYWPLGRVGLLPAEDGETAVMERPRRFSLPLRVLMEKLPLLALSAGSCVATTLSERAIVVSVSTCRCPRGWGMPQSPT